jgi:hypothetical protein
MSQAALNQVPAQKTRSSSRPSSKKPRKRFKVMIEKLDFIKKLKPRLLQIEKDSLISSFWTRPRRTFYSKRSSRISKKGS